MIERLIKLKLPILAVLEASAQKQDHQLLLKNFQWKLGADMVTASPMRNRDTVFSGEQCPTPSVVLTVVAGLEKGLRAARGECITAAVLGFLHSPDQ